MTPRMLFALVLIISIVLFSASKKVDGKAKAFIIILGALGCMFSVFGLVTSFL